MQQKIFNTFWRNAAYERLLPRLISVRNSDILAEIVQKSATHAKYDPTAYERGAAKYYKKHGTMGEF